MQLDEEEERRKRRREKNKVAAARCRNKKKERTEFLQRVSRAAGRAGRGLAVWINRRHQRCGNLISAAGIDVHLLLPAPVGCPILNQDSPGQPAAAPAQPTRIPGGPEKESERLELMNAELKTQIEELKQERQQLILMLNRHRPTCIVRTDSVKTPDSEGNPLLEQLEKK
ncbi:hypothetical protein QTO34_020059 [Cnephaeus nilssonii]|uniref:BZIP domain-containing protein n=1 Tax=Cnephaeus nilssonii TaxID=3371016 RepID=A0AA40LML6_CNENI|nr:hypothetical protein QTO34_020059 [Eptesicus nilssonii]